MTTPNPCPCGRQPVENLVAGMWELYCSCNGHDVNPKLIAGVYAGTRDEAATLWNELLEEICPD